MNRHASSVSGTGLGLRRELIPELRQQIPDNVAFFELAPENWLDTGGARARHLRWISERFPVVCHGLSLSLGGPQPLDTRLLRRIATFMRDHGMRLYTEHLAYTTDTSGHLYDLLPIPFTEDAVRYVAGRIRQTQDALGRRIAIENASYYQASPLDAMSELEFIVAVLEAADCDLHLDVNNVYINSVNHGYDPRAFLAGLPADRVVYLHTAGHQREAPDLLVDTHGASVSEPVWDLLALTYALFGPLPTLLERDFNIPPLAELGLEIDRIALLQAGHSCRGKD